MREDEANCDLTAAGNLAGSSTGLGVLQNIGVHLLHVIDACILATTKNDLGPECRESGTRGRGVCGRDLPLELRLEEGAPRFGNSQAPFVQDLLVRAEAQNAHVDTGPVVVRILVLVRNFLCGRGIVGLDQALFDCCTIAIHGAAVPDVELRVVLGRVQTCNGFTRRQANVARLDSGLRGESLGPLLAEIFHCTTRDGQRLLGSVSAVVVTALFIDDASGQGEGSDCAECNQGDEVLLHRDSPLNRGICKEHRLRRRALSGPLWTLGCTR